MNGGRTGKGCAQQWTGFKLPMDPVSLNEKSTEADGITSTSDLASSSKGPCDFWLEPYEGDL